LGGVDATKFRRLLLSIIGGFSDFYLVGSKLRHLLDKLTVRLLAQVPQTQSVFGLGIQQQQLEQRQTQ
jgi:hypothetical protein